MKPIDRSEDLLEAMQAMQEEPTIKVSELREWCEANYIYSEERGSLVIELHDLLARLCGGEK